MERLSDIGEDALIKRLVKGLSPGRDIVVGPGDDCAVVDLKREMGVGQMEENRYQLLKTDAIVEGVHYLPEAPAEQVGWKAVARVLSDFAAMGGVPGSLLITIALPSSQPLEYVEGLYRGMERCATSFGAVICGGETSAVPLGSAAVISVAGTGWVNASQLVLRSGGKAGDCVMVTGKLGGSIQGKHLTFTPRLRESAWLTTHFNLHAMMDLSDGLARDLPRLARASGCGYEIDRNRLPCNTSCHEDAALSDGEDYELLFTLASEDLEPLLSDWSCAFPELELTCVGTLCHGSGEEAVGGWQHFDG